MRRVVVKVKVLVSDIADPVQVAVNAIGKGVTPGAHQDRANHLQREIGKDGKAKRDWNMQAHAQFASDFDLAQRPGDKGA